jgi:hypothetical protein
VGQREERSGIGHYSMLFLGLDSRISNDLDIEKEASWDAFQHFTQGILYFCMKTKRLLEISSFTTPS